MRMILAKSGRKADMFKFYLIVLVSALIGLAAQKAEAFQTVTGYWMIGTVFGVIAGMILRGELEK